MGEMTIRVDDALLLALDQRAKMLGTDMDQLAADLLRAGLALARRDRGGVADAIRRRTRPPSIASVALLDQIRDEGL